MLKGASGQASTYRQVQGTPTRMGVPEMWAWTAPSHTCTRADKPGGKSPSQWESVESQAELTGVTAEAWREEFNLKSNFIGG